MNLSQPQKRAILVASYIWATVGLTLWATEPMRREPLLPGGFTFWITLDTFVPLLGIVAALFFPTVAALRVLAERRITLAALHPVLPIGIAITAAITVDWEGRYFKSRWEDRREGYATAVREIMDGPALGQTGLFAVTYGEVVPLPPTLRDLSLEGVVLRRTGWRDSKDLVFLAASWWTDNWIGYVYVSRAGQRPRGEFYRAESLNDHWWLVGGT